MNDSKNSIPNSEIDLKNSDNTVIEKSLTNVNISIKYIILEKNVGITKYLGFLIAWRKFKGLSPPVKNGKKRLKRRYWLVIKIIFDSANKYTNKEKKQIIMILIINTVEKYSFRKVMLWFFEKNSIEWKPKPQSHKIQQICTNIIPAATMP